ncbi:E3 ubiquitin-protein ligase TRIM21-like [Hyperolius riggenbachi]|uniref:E3 ubiquitin-protein ligase TRIM21-like n=1 Tax=Hyperolius riggenbachi TaxID=752182 RepID=UPI0035A35437
MASADLKKGLDCSICLNIYTDPVTLRCGHSFCRLCIEQVLDSQEASGRYSCPECRQKFEKRPRLQKNIALHNIVENLLGAQPEEKETQVFCTYCVEDSVPAVKSCLLCEACLCDKHLKVHSKSPEHVLCDPSTSLGNRKCSVHKKILEYYCTEDSACICASCSAGEHRRHQVETVDEASEKRKTKLGDFLAEVIKAKQEAEKTSQSLQEHRRKVKEDAADVTKKAITLFRDVKRRLDNLERRVMSDISLQVEQVSRTCDYDIQQLEMKVEELSRKIHQIEELCNMTDPLTVLQESDTGDLCDTEEGHIQDLQLHDRGNLDVAGISHTLYTGLSAIITGANGGMYIPKPEALSLDVNTANKYLHISDDKKIALKSALQNRSYTSERYLKHPQVMSSQSFSSGQHYWDIDVGGSDDWRVGMCYSGISKKEGYSLIGSNDYPWCLMCSSNSYKVMQGGTEETLPHSVSANRIRIYLDYEGGVISFYELGIPIRHLHTFTDTFTERIYGVLNVGKGYLRIVGVIQGM